MAPETDTLTHLLETFLSAFKLGRVEVGGEAWSLLSILATLEILLASLWWTLRGDNFTAPFLKKVILIGFFIFVVSNWDSLITQVVAGFIHTGETAARAAGGSVVSIENPSAIIDAGFRAALPIFNHIKNFTSISSVLSNVPDILLSIIASFIIVGAYFVMAIQVFVTRLEFGLIATLGLILVPFGVFKQTAFLTEKVFGAIISFGVKLMVLSFIISVTFPVLVQYQLPPDPDWPQLFSMMAIALAVMALAWHAPGVAAGLLSGSPTLTAGSAVGTALATGAAGAGAGFALGQASRTGVGSLSAVKKGASLSSSGVSGVSHTAAKAAGAVHGSINAPGSTLGSLAQRASSAGASKFQQTVGSPLRAASNSIKESYKSGREFRPASQQTSEAVKKMAPAKASNASSFSSSVAAIDIVKRSVPEEEQPQVSNSTPVRRGGR